MPKNAAGIELRQSGNNKARNCVLQAFKGPRGERKWECRRPPGRAQSRLRRECRRPNPSQRGNAGGPIPPNEGMAEPQSPPPRRWHTKSPSHPTPTNTPRATRKETLRMAHNTPSTSTPRALQAFHRLGETIVHLGKTVVRPGKTSSPAIKQAPQPHPETAGPARLNLT